MKTYKGYIKYNDALMCYGLVDRNGNWIKESLEEGDRFDIAISEMVLAANYSKEYQEYFKPHGIDARTFADRTPVLYYDFEKASQPSEKEMAKQRWKSGLLAIGISIAVCAVLAAVFWLFFKSSYLIIFAMIYGIFGAPWGIGGLMALMGMVPEKLCFGFGCGLYFGTLILARILSGVTSEPLSSSYIISFVIVALVCYIVWLTNFKSDYKK